MKKVWEGGERAGGRAAGLRGNEGWGYLPCGKEAAELGSTSCGQFLLPGLELGIQWGACGVLRWLGELELAEGSAGFCLKVSLAYFLRFSWG